MKIAILDDYQQIAMQSADWKSLPAGTEVALLQFLIALDTNLQMVPTPLVESVRLLIFKKTDGNPDPETFSGIV